MFWATFSPIIGSTLLYLQYLVVFTQAAAGLCHQPAATWMNTTYKIMWLTLTSVWKELLDGWTEIHECTLEGGDVTVWGTCTGGYILGPLSVVSVCNRSNSTKSWHSWIHASWYNYENNQQDALYRLIYYSKSALHVLGDVFAHHREHLTVFTVSGSVHPSCCWLVTPAGSSLGEHYQIL